MPTGGEQADRSRPRDHPNFCRMNAIVRRLATASLLCHATSRDREPTAGNSGGGSQSGSGRGPEGKSGGKTGRRRGPHSPALTHATMRVVRRRRGRFACYRIESGWNTEREGFEPSSDRKTRTGFRDRCGSDRLQGFYASWAPLWARYRARYASSLAVFSAIASGSRWPYRS